MTTWSTRIACAVFAFAATAHADDDEEEQGGQDRGGGHHREDIKWGEAPPDLPKGAQIAVLHGDPSKAGQFTVRLKMPDGYKIPPHWHTQGRAADGPVGHARPAHGRHDDGRAAHARRRRASTSCPARCITAPRPRARRSSRSTARDRSTSTT